MSVSDKNLIDGFQKALASAGESTTGQLFAFNLKGCSQTGEETSPVFIHAVQDRGVSRAGDYPTYVFTTSDGGTTPHLTFKTHSGKKLYLADEIVCQPNHCLLAAEQGYSDICLSDPFGEPAPELPGLRKDFWSDLIKLFGS